MSYIVLPSGVTFERLEDALDCARLDSATGPDFWARVEDADTEDIVAHYRKGEKL